MSDIVVKCPHCGTPHDISDTAPWDLDESKEFDCEKCGKQFEVEAEYKFIKHRVVIICSECGERGDDCFCGEDEGRQG